MITGTKLQKMIILYAGKIHNYATLTEMGAGTGRHGSNHVRKRQACRKQNQTQKHDLTKKTPTVTSEPHSKYIRQPAMLLRQTVADT